MPMASLMHDRFVAALSQGLGDADWSAIARVAYKSAALWGRQILSKYGGSYE
jgi:hypothetical protein